MTTINYSKINVSDSLYHRTNNNVTCFEFNLKDHFEKDSFNKLLTNLKSAFKGSNVKVYFSKAIFEFDENGNFIPDPKRMGFNKCHSGFLVETGTNFDKPKCESVLKAIDDMLVKAIQEGVYKITLPKVKTATKSEMELTIAEQAELLATLQEKTEEKNRRIAYLENLCKEHGIAY